MGGDFERGGGGLGLLLDLGVFVVLLRRPLLWPESGETVSFEGGAERVRERKVFLIFEIERASCRERV